METTSSVAANADRADVVVFPPLIGAVLIGSGVALHLAFPAQLLPNWELALGIGLPVLAGGIALQVACIRMLRRAGTDVIFKRPTSVILKRGPYEWSRNPIYLSVMAQVVGLSFALNTVWLLALSMLLLLYFQFWVIAREERYLERRFGDEYRAYKSSVRRWI